MKIGGSLDASKIGLLEAPNNLILPLLENKILNGIEANGRKSFKFGKNVGVWFSEFSANCFAKCSLSSKL